MLSCTKQAAANMCTLVKVWIKKVVELQEVATSDKQTDLIPCCCSVLPLSLQHP